MNIAITLQHIFQTDWESTYYSSLIFANYLFYLLMLRAHLPKVGTGFSIAGGTHGRACCPAGAGNRSLLTCLVVIVSRTLNPTGRPKDSRTIVVSRVYFAAGLMVRAHVHLPGLGLHTLI